MNLKRHILFAVFLSTASVMQAADLPETFPAEQVTKYNEIKSAFDAFEAKIQLPDAAMSEALWNEWKSLRTDQLRWIDPILEKAESVALRFDGQSESILQILYRLQPGLNPRTLTLPSDDFPAYLKDQSNHLTSKNVHTSRPLLDLIFRAIETKVASPNIPPLSRKAVVQSQRPLLMPSTIVTSPAAPTAIKPMTPMKPAQPVVTVSRPVSASTPLKVPELPSSLRLPVRHSTEPESLADRVTRIIKEGKDLIKQAELEGEKNPTVISDTVAGLGEDVSNACKSGLARVTKGLRKIF